MAKKIYESRDRDDAHRHQADVIANGTAPRACCTEHVERGDSVIVWDDTPTLDDLARLAQESTQ